MLAPILIIAIGNESRGDDALAPLLSRSVQAGFDHPDFEFIEDFQLQVEHVTDLVGRQKILFLDADVSCAAPYHFSAITAAQDNSYSSHAMTHFALLYTYRQVYGEDAPSSYLLRLRGYGFELGEDLSAEAAANMKLAKAMVYEWLTDFRGARE